LTNGLFERGRGDPDLGRRGEQIFVGRAALELVLESAVQNRAHLFVGVVPAFSHRARFSLIPRMRSGHRRLGAHADPRERGISGSRCSLRNAGTDAAQPVELRSRSGSVRTDSNARTGARPTSRGRRCLTTAGTPTAVVPAGTSRITTALAPMRA